MYHIILYMGQNSEKLLIKRPFQICSSLGMLSTATFMAQAQVETLKADVTEYSTVRLGVPRLRLNHPITSKLTFFTYSYEMYFGEN